MTRRCLPLSLIAFALIAMLIFFGCSAKQTPPPAAVEAPAESAEAEAGMMGESPEAAMQPESPEAKEAEAKEAEALSLPTVPEGSVLHLIPEHILGLIYCPSLAELDARLNALAQELMPMAEPPELLASILADTFGAGFESLAELEEIGLDLNKDFAIFFTSLEPVFLSATVHLTEPEAIMQVIEMEAEGTAPVEYNGVTYWNAAGGGGSFAILDDILVFSQQPEVCENAIDAHQGNMQAVTKNADYAAFLTDAVASTAQLAVYFDIETIAPDLSASLKKGLAEMVDSLESAPESAAAAPVVEKVYGTLISLVVEQLKNVSLTLQVEGTDVQFAPFLTFKPDSELYKAIGEAPRELTLLGGLPDLVYFNGAMQMNPETLMKLGRFSMGLFMQRTPEQREIAEALFQQMDAFYEAQKGNMAFSMNFDGSIMPDMLYLCEIQAAQKVGTYMDEALLKQFDASAALMEDTMGRTPYARIYKDAHRGTPEMHNGVEIKSYVFPNFGLMFADMPFDVAPGLNWYYAVTEGHFLWTMGESSQSLKDALDRLAGTGTSLAANPSYQHLARKLGTAHHLFWAFSPMTVAKSLLPVLAQSDANNAAAMQMFSGMLMNLPETYSIGITAASSTRGQDKGVGAQLLITVGDFKQLIQMIAMMAGGSQG